MKKKYITISISIFLLFSLILSIVNKDNKRYIMQDGIMLALTLDGEKITSYPEGTNYRVEINCENGKGKWLLDEWKLAVEEVTGNVVCNINFISNPKLLKTEVESKASTNTNGYRYTGKSPNNYVWFNNELWRIIGSIPTCLSASCGTNTTNLVKIIRDQSIGILAFDSKVSGCSSNWGSNSLYTLLNSYYLGKNDATSTSNCCGKYEYSISKPNCNYTFKGIETDGYYGKMIKNVYWNIGGSSTGQPNQVYNYEIQSQTTQGYIGLMSASDYAYAAAIDYTSGASYLYNYNSYDINKLNWLYGQGVEWTINPQLNQSCKTLLIKAYGNVEEYTTHYGSAVRPVVYLDSTVFVMSGDGTQSNPYQIGM